MKWHIRPSRATRRRLRWTGVGNNQVWQTLSPLHYDDDEDDDEDDDGMSTHLSQLTPLHEMPRRR